MTTQKSTMFDRLLKQSILTLCKEAIVFDDNLVIDGIICLTCDGGLQQVIKVHELFLKVGNKSPNATMPASGASSVEIRQSTQEPNVQCVNNASLEVSNNASTSRESEGIKRVADVNAAATADTNNNRTNAEVNEAATADTNNNRTNAEVNAAVTADTHNNRTNAEVNTFQEHKVTQNDSDSPVNNDRRWLLYHKPPLRHNVDNNTRNNGTGNKTPSSGPATEAGTANTSNPELRTLITKPALNNNNCASKIGKDNAKESGTPRVTGTTAAAASMGDQTRRKTSTGRANTPIMKQKDWKIPDLSEISAERQKTTDINSNVAYANAAADGETAAKRPKLMTEVTIKVDQLDDASNESIETDSPTQYSKTSVLGMETDFSSADNLSSAYTNTKVRPPQGFKKVLTPDKRFKSKGSFTCNLCDAKFTDFDNFNVHCDLVHHTYFCKYCGKSFKSKSNRERHAGYHTGTRPYTCDDCGVSFFRVGDLKYHTTSKHAPKLYACVVCKETFAYRKQLEKHFTAYPEHM